MTPDRAKFNKEVEKGLLDRGVNTPIRAMTEQETMEQRIKIQADQIASLKRQIGRLETQLANELLVDDGSPLTPHGEAIAAGDGTLHGAIDYWQERALKAESDLLKEPLWRNRALKAEADAFQMAAGQCCVKSGGLMADDHGHQYCDMERQRDEWKRKAEEAERDAGRYRWLIKQVSHDEFIPIAQVVWKQFSNPHGEWVNLINGADLDAHIDSHLPAIAAKGEA